MAWFVAQVWVLCAVAFLLGAAVTWLLFVRPLRRARPPEPAPEPVTAAVPVAAPAAPPAPPEDPPVPPVDPALAALDTPPVGPPERPGHRARAALDLLGVEPSGLAPPIPQQHGPTDDETPDPR